VHALRGSSVDPELELRYVALVQRYRDYAAILPWSVHDADRSDDFRQLERLILPRSHDLRPDALLCLLTLYDEMILTPYRGQLATGDGEILPRLPIGRDRDEFFKRVRQSLEVIFQRLSEAPERPISSHQVLRAIDRGWSELSRIFGWG
jgi:hypothetical protein